MMLRHLAFHKQMKEFSDLLRTKNFNKEMGQRTVGVKKDQRSMFKS